MKHPKPAPWHCRTFVGWIAGLGLTITGSALAQEKPRPAVEIGAGWTGFPDDALVNEMSVGGSARWHLLPRVSVGPEVVYINGDKHSHLAMTGNLTLDVLSPMDTRGYRVMPFVVVGGGMFQTREAFAVGDFTSSEGMFTSGGGVRSSASDRVTVGIDVRVGWETHIRINGFLGFRLGP